MKKPTIINPKRCCRANRMEKK